MDIAYSNTSDSSVGGPGLLAVLVAEGVEFDAAVGGVLDGDRVAHAEIERRAAVVTLRERVAAVERLSAAAVGHHLPVGQFESAVGVDRDLVAVVSERRLADGRVVPEQAVERVRVEHVEQPHVQIQGVDVLDAGDRSHDRVADRFVFGDPVLLVRHAVTHYPF